MAGVQSSNQTAGLQSNQSNHPGSGTGYYPPLAQSQQTEHHAQVQQTRGALSRCTHTLLKLLPLFSFVGLWCCHITGRSI